MTTLEIMQTAKEVSIDISMATSEEKDNLLKEMAKALLENTDYILAENAKDMEAARQVFTEVKLDRLLLNKQRIEAMAKGILEVVDLPDPVGQILSEVHRPNGLLIQKKSVPLGVIAIIYESRPNVTSDAAALILKSGNACILRSGKEAWKSAHAIVTSLQKGIEKAGFNKNILQLVEDTTRASANELMNGVGYIDLLIPRGGKGLIQSCLENAKVPCIETGTGICSVYVDYNADLEMALNIVENAKTSRPSVCNAEECLLVHKDIAPQFLPLLQKRIPQVELRCEPKALQIIDGIPATDADFDTEFLDYILAIKVVDSVQEAIAHISKHSTHHSEAIVTKDMKNAELFINQIDSSSLYVNCSTRFTDGGEFGLGCEMGISTQKLHARGPMGLKELTTYKYIILGNGQVR